MLRVSTGIAIRVDMDGREVTSSRPSDVAITPFNVLISEGSGSVKGLFGFRRRIAHTDAVDMENVSNEKCSVVLVFSSPREVMGLAAASSYLSSVARIARDWDVRVMCNRQEAFSLRLLGPLLTSHCP